MGGDIDFKDYEQDQGQLFPAHLSEALDRCEVADFRVEHQGENLATVHVDWRVFNTDGALLWEFANTYNLADYGEG